MRFTEFKPFLVEFANVDPDASLEQVKNNLDSIAQVVSVLPPEATVEIKKIALDFAQTQEKVNQFLAQLESMGKLEDDDSEYDEVEDDEEGMDSEFPADTAQEVPTEPVEPVAAEPAQQPVAQPAVEPTAAEEPAPEEPPVEEPAPEEEISEALEDTTADVSGDTEYNEAVQSITQAREAIAYIESVKMPAAAKKRIIAQYQDTINRTEKIVKKYEAAVIELRTEKEKRRAAEKFADDVFDILEKLANKVQGYVQISPEDYAGLNKTQKKIHDNARTFASTFKTAFFGMVLNMLRQNEQIDRAAISNFLSACYNGEVIDMIGLVQAGAGNVKSHVNQDYTEMLDLFASYGVFSWTPGKTGGAIGPGEMALSMMGSPAEKAKEGGDLIINGVKLEIKAGSTSGGRLNSKKILKGPAAWPIWTKGIEDIINSKNKAIPKDATWEIKDKKGNVQTVNKAKFSANTFNITNNKAKLGAKYNFNYRHLNLLNEEVLIYSDPDKTFNLFYNTFATLITNLDEVAKASTDKKGDVIRGPDNKPLFPGVNAQNLVWKAINEDGTIDVNAMMAAYTRLAYESYNRADHVESIMFLNTTTLDYSIATNSQDLLQRMGGKDQSTVRITGGFNFNDDQQSATPAYLATARSEKIVKK
jgi:chemotaxis protein histidine kinase CheA